MGNDLFGKITEKALDFITNKAQEQMNKPDPVIQMSVSNNLKPITKEDLLKGRDRQYPNEYSQEISDNLDKVVIVINKIQNAYGVQFEINSGWRPSAVNSSTPGAAKKSKHMEGLAVDIKDNDGKIMEWTLNNLQLMKDLGVYMEDWRWTPTWTHYQIVPPKSGNRIFIPSTAPALAPNRWKGKYSRLYL